MGKAVVVGLARSGLGAAKLLLDRGYSVAVTDLRPEEELGEMLAELPPSVEHSLGGHSSEVFEGAELVVLSPGVPLHIPSVKKAGDAGAKVIGELELAYAALPGVTFYAVTGTNGKSTTVTLLDLMMNKAGRKSLLGGNIGNALSYEITRGMAEGIDCVVAEVSSFQLETIETFRPAGAALLNVTPDHLDRYPSMREYRAAKARIALNQRPEDTLVLNADDPECMEIYKKTIVPRKDHAPGVFFFSRQKEVRGVFTREGKLMWDFHGSGSGEIMSTGDMGIRGVHNLENAMAAAAVALLAGCPAPAVRESLREFRGLEHRLEFIREVNGVRYVNDSKGTNVGAVIRSVESFAEPVVLIAGGRDKGGDFALLARALKGRAKAVVLMGEAKEKLRAALEGKVDYYLAGDLRDALVQASGLASKGDVVLLSPACASFDMFRDFEERGKAFKREVMAL